MLDQPWIYLSLNISLSISLSLNGLLYPQAYFFFFFLWTGLPDPIESSIVGGGIPTQNSGYKSARLFPSKFRFCYFVTTCRVPGPLSV